MSEIKQGNQYSKKHGHTSGGSKRSPEYASWSSMIQRCSDKNHSSYMNYGAKGVRVCAEWTASFEQFLADMGSRPDGHSIDRINPSGNYEPSNCRWASSKTQQNNRTNNRFVTVDGVRMTVAELAVLAGIPLRTAYNRVNRLSRLELTISDVQRS